MACGGGGGGSGSSAAFGSTPGQASSAPNWTSGVFASEATFKDRCLLPRSGTSDAAGSTTLENFWLRSWSNRTYLWYDEITDRDPASISDREAYFETQKTTATTASGTPKDQFHFTAPTDEYNQSVSSGAALGYGARFVLISPSAPREARIAYVQPGSPAQTAGLTRGMEIIAVDGTNFRTGAPGPLNAGLFPENADESHTLTVRAPGATADTTVTLRSAVVTQDPVLVTKVITTDDETPKKIGYALFNTFGTARAEKALFDAFTALEAEGADELVLDLRYNGGGFLTIAGQLGYMTAGSANTQGRTFERIQFNDQHPVTDPVTGARLIPADFPSTGQNFSVAPGTALPSLNLNRVYILTSEATCSASESLINGLRGINIDVVIVGKTTCGKPYGFYPTDNCGLTYFTVQFVGVNAQGFGDYADGFTPQTNGPATGTPIKGCFVSDDFSAALGDENEAMLSAALTHIATGACPPAPSGGFGLTDKTRRAATDPASSLLNSERQQRRLFIEQGRILGGPQR